MTDQGIPGTLRLYQLTTILLFSLQMPYEGRIPFTAAFQQGLLESIRSLDGHFISTQGE